MEIKVGDYVEGVEHYGSTTRVTKGWVDSIRKSWGGTTYDIQADDNWKGARGTILFSELGEVRKLKPKPRP